MAARIDKLIKSHKDLTNAVSHELRTPVARIKFGMEMLKGAEKNTDVKRYISGVESDVNEIDSLVDELLTYARFDREPEKEGVFNINLVSWFIEIVENEKENLKGKTLEYNCSSIEKSRETRINPRYMIWVVQNLIRNAACYAKSVIHITLEESDTFLMIHVDDDGPGILPDERRQIFKPFFRIDDSRFRKSGGYGLGLSIVEKVITWHGGSCSVTESDLNGARFTVSWPKK